VPLARAGPAGWAAAVSTRRRAVVLTAGAVVALLLLATWHVGTHRAPAVGPSAGSVRLGPEPGEDVAGYLARLPATLPAGGVRAPALVQLANESTGPDALAAVAGTTPRTAVFRVPLPRVQTALRFVDVEQGVPVAAALVNARGRAEQAAAADAQRLTGRPGVVAAAEARALADPACRCVLALLVDGDRAALVAVAARAGVRAVEAAPPGTVAPALAPLLPEQTARANPPPDDGLVPAAP
jgi:hypothetical protein